MKYFYGISLMSLALFLCYNIYSKMQNDVILSNIMLANVEALTRNEGSESKTWQVGNKTITTKIYKTTSPGWVWNSELNLWLYKGEVTANCPADYYEETSSTSFKCCREQGDLTVCNYETC